MTGIWMVEITAESILQCRVNSLTTPPPEVGGGGAAFDPATVSNAALSNADLTVTRSNTSTGGVASTAYKNSGKYYFEVTIGASHATTDFIGIKAATVSYGDITNGSAGNYAGYWPVHGSTVTSGTGFGGLGSASAGDIISVAVDLVNYAVWMRRNGGNWNGTSTADPATNNGGGGAISGSLAPVIGFSNFGSPVGGDNFTANFGATAFAYAVPFGFTAGWPP
ncbi:hypothetical protein ABIF29_003996 [Bradyrhizobium elkanii]|uniref:B30.2/SPRY domain-containing protein n=2 Tax=Bradyrhizobium elkanii TaxID=29448 RepID=A0ABV4F1A4_BRAEL